ncbi:isochorismatase domain-containing protein 2-like isoform X1 [Oncorhynchus masou masou]|uniref:isochorismatase domain-containing protein 2-like isoform X1 n=1 Tax=Oncorhynchus masou masou TaxID=90313 RepID=UPI003183B6D4
MGKTLHAIGRNQCQCSMHLIRLVYWMLERFRILLIRRGCQLSGSCRKLDLQVQPFYTSTPNMAGIGRLSTKGSVLLLCDMQEKFRPNIFQFTNIVSNAARLLQAARVLGIPPIVTEQYPKGLGPTVPELGAGDLTAHAKTKFTMMIEPVEKELKALGDPKIAILCGIETQACIACTTFDLLEKGMEVHIVADAVSSRSQTDRLFALSRLRQSGAFLTTTEAVLLQLVQDAQHPNFREIQKLLVQPSPDTALLAFFSSL